MQCNVSNVFVLTLAHFYFKTFETSNLLLIFFSCKAHFFVQHNDNTIFHKSIM